MTQNLCVLVVDDSEFFAEMTANTLSRDHGMETHWAGGPEEGLELLGEHEIDCIVSDYDMPEMNGLEFLDAVRDEFGDIPFIILTGRGDEETASRAISAGVADYILKLEVVEDQQYQQLANRIENAVAQQRAQQRYELLVDNTPDAVAQVTAEGEILAANPAMAEFADAAREYLLGADIREILPADIGDRWLSAGRTAITSGDIQEEETEVDGRHFQNIFVPVDIRTERDTFQLIARDVTERTQREQELQRQNERLDEFASMVSHDLRNPLDVASVNLSLLEEQFDDPPIEIEKIDEAHARMTRLIDDVLTLARQGTTVEEPQPTDVGQAAEDVWPYVDTDGADLEASADGVILADTSRLQELLSNLIRNAIEHGDAATIQVDDLPEGFYVADDGEGIPQGDQPAVFETGFSTADEGTGFGLAIVEQIAEAHGWSVTVTDSESDGAQFEITDVEFVDP
jgi:PAS domain S-box-containing protein